MSERVASPVYSSEKGRLCPGCGEGEGACACPARARVAIPKKLVAKLRLESKGRAGKCVTVLYDLPRNESFVAELCASLKRALGTGGAARDGAVELQGDCRERARALLVARGYMVKGG